VNAAFPNFLPGFFGLEVSSFDIRANFSLLCQFHTASSSFGLLSASAKNLPLGSPLPLFSTAAPPVGFNF